MDNENETLGKLVVTEQDSIKEMEKLVEQAQKFFRIEKPTGRILFQDFGSLSDKQRIAVVLLGKYLAARLKIVEIFALSISEIANELGRPRTALSGPIKELVSRGYVAYLRDKKKYCIDDHRLRNIFDDILCEKPRG